MPTKLNGFKSVIHKLQNVDSRVKHTIESGVKRHVKNIKDEIRKGLVQEKFGHKKLSALTLKIREHYPPKQSESPLVGNYGMIDSLEVTKGNKGYLLKPNNKMTSSKPPNGKAGKKKAISWSRLWNIHENGTNITVTQKMSRAFIYWFGIPLKVGKKLNIPARKTFDKALKKYLQSQARKKENEKIQKDIKKLYQ